MKLEELMAGEILNWWERVTNWWEQVLRSEIPMNNLMFKRSGIGIIVEFWGIPSGFPNQDNSPPQDSTQRHGGGGCQKSVGSRSYHIIVTRGEASMPAPMCWQQGQRLHQRLWSCCSSVKAGSNNLMGGLSLGEGRRRIR
jgi:hypothetical protein